MRKMRTRKQRREKWKKNLDTFAEKMRREPTKYERLLWNALNEIAAHEGWYLQNQYVITPFIADICIANKDVVIEVDGRAHALRKAKDEYRDRFLQEKGFRVIRIMNDEVSRDLAGCVERVRRFV